MDAEQRGLIYFVASAAMVLLLALGVLYLTGNLIAVGAHDQRAKVCFIGAAAAAIVAFAARKGDRPRV